MKTKTLVLLLLICCTVGIVASFVASSFPDGLERIAENIGFISLSSGAEKISSPMPDYMAPWIKNEHISAPVTAVIGTMIMFAVATILGKLLEKKPK